MLFGGDSLHALHAIQQENGPYKACLCLFGHKPILGAMMTDET